MGIEEWKDTAFGSDYGGDFLDFLEKIDSKILTLDLIYKNSNLKERLYIKDVFIKEKNYYSDVQLYQEKDFEQIVHYEEAIIALSAIVTESLFNNGSADMRKAYGSKILKFKITNDELILIRDALNDIYKYPTFFNLFDMIDNNMKNIVLNDIVNILIQMNIAQRRMA